MEDEGGGYETHKPTAYTVLYMELWHAGFTVWSLEVKRKSGKVNLVCVSGAPFLVYA